MRARDGEKQEHWTNFTVIAERERKDKRAKGQNVKVAVLAERLQQAAPARLWLPLLYVSIRQRDLRSFIEPQLLHHRALEKYAEN